MALADWLEDKSDRVVECDEGMGEVGFLDLSRVELGDEWTFVERLLGHVAGLRDNEESEGSGTHSMGRSVRPHLIIIDSIPGLETASGSKDIFGQVVSTQERINRLIKVLRDQSHLVFTSAYEETAEAARREEAQADIVYRLAFDVRNGVPLRTITVTKARGYDHSIEPHPIEFVSPGGATFSSRRADRDVRSNTLGSPRYERNTGRSRNATQHRASYVQVYPSVQWLLAAVKRHLPEDSGVSALSVDELVELTSLAEKLKTQNREFDTWLFKQLHTVTQRDLISDQGRQSDGASLRQSLVQDLNKIMFGASIYKLERFGGIKLRQETTTLMLKNPEGEQLQRLNRLLIEDAYPLEISRKADCSQDVPLVPLAASGIKYLDNMLSRAVRSRDVGAASTKAREYNKTFSKDEERLELLFGDRFGIPCGSLTKITGPEQTHKSHLANSFARHSLAIFARYALAVLDQFLSTHGPVESVLRESPGWNSDDWRRHCSSLEKRATDLVERARVNGNRGALLTSKSKLRALRSFLSSSRRGRGIGTTSGNGCSTLAAIIQPLEAAYSLPEATSTVVSSSNVVERLAEIVWRIVEDFGPERRVILLTTRYLDFEQAEQSFGAYLRERYSLPLKRISRKLVFMLGDEDAGDEFLLCFAAKASTLWRGRVVYRRLVPRDLVPEIFFHVVRRNLESVAAEVCERLSARPERYDWLQPITSLAAGNADDCAVRRVEAIGAIRVIVDDLQAVQLACSGRDQEYAALCSLLTSYLRMRGVTSILVESSPADGSRPTASGTPAGRPERFHIIRTWRVRVEGADRVGITIDPALNPDLHGCVRELKVQKGKYLDKIAIVDPDFELYSNLGAGTPAVIPLEVHLLIETPNIDLYCQREESFLGTFFRGVPDSQNSGRSAIIQRRAALNYGLLQDLATYPNPLTATPKTVVIQVDGYWNQSRQGNLRDLYDYLFRDVTPGTDEERRFEDQFRKFEPSLYAEDQGHLDIRSRYGVLDWRRGRGRNLRYISRISDIEGRLDRVPYTWDYGFILIDLPAWKRAVDNLSRMDEDGSSVALKASVVPVPASPQERRDLLTVIKGIVDVADGLVDKRPGGGQECLGHYDWFRFALATQWVAALEQHRASAAREETVVSGLATASLRPSSLDCLLLEMWFSEVYSLLLSTDAYGSNPDSASLASFLSRVSRPDFEPPWHGDDPFGLARGLVGLLHRRTPALLQVDDLRDAETLANRLIRADKGISSVQGYMARRLVDVHPLALKRLRSESRRVDNLVGVKRALLHCLNCLVRDEGLWSADHFREVDFQLGTRRLIRKFSKDGRYSPELNRLLLEDVFPENIVRRDHGYIQKQFSAIRSIIRAIREGLDCTRGKGLDQLPDDSKEQLNILRELLHNGFALQLYKCWLLILETFDISSYLPTYGNAGPVEKDRRPVRHAVAVRHWYKTACQATSAIASLPDGRAEWRAIPMPGHFSVRGDWYLGVLKGSRSVRLGELALDVLTDEKANLTRLKMGVGLPVRDVRPDAASVEHTSTGLLKFDGNRIPQPVMLGEFLNLTSAKSFKHRGFGDAGSSEGSADDPRLSDSAGKNSRFWLWRSGLGGYDAQCESFRHWIRNLMQWTVAYRVQNLSTWEGGGGKRAYLAIAAIEKLAMRGKLPLGAGQEEERSRLMEELEEAISVMENYASFAKFAELCDDLHDRLIHVTPAREW